MVKQENNCNGCADCICCGRNRNIKVIACDDCEETLYEEAYKINDKILCRECAIEYINDNIDDMVLCDYKERISE